MTGSKAELAAGLGEQVVMFRPHFQHTETNLLNIDFIYRPIYTNRLYIHTYILYIHVCLSIVSIV